MGTEHSYETAKIWAPSLSASNRIKTPINNSILSSYVHSLNISLNNTKYLASDKRCHKIFELNNTNLAKRCSKVPTLIHNYCDVSTSNAILFIIQGDFSHAYGINVAKLRRSFILLKNEPL